MVKLWGLLLNTDIVTGCVPKFGSAVRDGCGGVWRRIGLEYGTRAHPTSPRQYVLRGLGTGVLGKYHSVRSR